METFSIGIRHFFAATAFLSRHQLLHFYLFPIVLSILFYIGITASIIGYSREISVWLFGNHMTESIKTFDGSWSFLNNVSGDLLQRIAAIFIGIFIFLLAAKLSKYILLILLSPLFAYLSEIVEEKLTGKLYPFSIIQLISDTFRGIVIALRNFIIELSLIIFFGFIGLFGGPFAILIMPALWLIGAYFYGFSMIDYTCERRKLSIRQSKEFIWKHKGLAIANGGLYALFDMIPVVGLVIAPINAVVGATTALLEIENRQL